MASISEIATLIQTNSATTNGLLNEMKQENRQSREEFTLLFPMDSDLIQVGRAK